MLIFQRNKRRGMEKTGREDHPTDEKHLYPYSLLIIAG